MQTFSGRFHFPAMATFQVLKNSLNLLKISKSIPFSFASTLKHDFKNPVSRSYSSQAQKCLMEFFDVEDNWNKNEVRVGRAWRKEELRIKSNEDLHKLWFILLKERNMLLTMEEEYKRNMEPFPSPERLYKVKESMVHLEEVVRERNKAYYLLETGETGERPGKVAVNQLGINYFYKMAEHVLPKECNGSWFARRKMWANRKETGRFLSLYREKLWLEKRRARVRDRNHVAGLLKRFPDIDIDYLRESYPHVDIDKLLTSRVTDGHFVRSTEPSAASASL